MWEVTTPDALIFTAGALYTLGYLIINQVILRLMIGAGSLAYIGYYFTVAEAPLWGAIAATGLILTANAIGLASLLLQNAVWTVPRAHRDIYPLFAPLGPGDFRALMRRGHRHRLTEDTVATTMGQTTNTVYFVIAGDYAVEKFGLGFSMHGPTFVGEVAHLMDAPSAATTTFPAGLEVITWDRAALTDRARRSPRFKLALEAVMSRDLARKVALAVAPPQIPAQTTTAVG